jgi:hypothetical protein
MQAATLDPRPDLELNETVRASSPASELLWAAARDANVTFSGILREVGL